MYFQEFCFACGLYLVTQRAHILAVAEGGEDTVENIHLLCKRCHDESEMLSGDKYWNWFAGKDEGLAFEYWCKEREARVKRMMEAMVAIKEAESWSRTEIKEFIKENLYKL